MTQTITIPEALAVIAAQLDGVRGRQLDDNREREAAIKAKAVKLSTAQLVEVLRVAQALANLPLGVLRRTERTDVADVLRAYSREYTNTRF